MDCLGNGLQLYSLTFVHMNWFESNQSQTEVKDIQILLPWKYMKPPNVQRTQDYAQSVAEPEQW